jgi:hypothetical protein
MSDEKLNVGINFNVTGNADAAGALTALGTAAKETAVEFDQAAVSAKAMADAVTAAQALAALGIKASAAGGVNAEGQGLVTVAAEEQATAQSILNKLKLDAVAVTKAEAAATLEAAAAKAQETIATERVAAADDAAAVAAQRLAISDAEVAAAIKAQNLNGATNAIEQEATGATSALSGMWVQLVAVVAALEAYNKAKEFISAGVEFNATIESAKLGIAASVNAVGQLADAQGRALEGQEKFGAATALADDQIQKLFADSARTSTTVQQLVVTYQSAIAAGINAGANLDQIRRLTTDAALAAGALNIPYSQLSVTLVQLLEGHTRITNRLSQELGITQADLREWKEKGVLVEKLLETFGKYESLGSRVQGTWRGVMSNVTEFFQQFSGAATEGAFTTLESGIKGQLGRVFDFNTGKLTSDVQGAATLMREGLGGGAQLVVSLVGKIIDGLEAMGTWFENNREKAEELGRGFLDIVTSTGRILAGIVEITVKIAAWAAGSIVLQAVLRAIGDVIGFVADHIGVIVAGVAAIMALVNAAAIDTFLGGLGAGIAAFAIANPITLLIGTIVALTAAVEYHNIAQERALALAQAARDRMGEQAGTTAGLVEQYKQLATAIDSGKLSDTEATSAKARLKTVTDELIKISPAYRDALSAESESLKDKLATVEKLNAAQIADLELKREAALAQNTSDLAQLHAIDAQLDAAAKASGHPTSEGGAAINDARLAQLTKQHADAQAKFNTSDADFHGYVTAIEKVTKAQDDARTSLATLHKGGGGEDRPTKGLDTAEANAEIERMNAQAETIKRALDGQLSRNEISYADYFAKLNAIELAALDVQIAQKQQLLEKTTDPKQKAKLGADIEKLQDEETQVVEKNAAKRLQLEEQYEKQRTALAVQAMKDRGQTEEAFEIEFNQKHKAEAERARVENDEATLANIDYLHDAELARMRADRSATEARGVTSDTEGTVRGTQASVENGTLSEARGRQIIIAAYQREREAILAALDAAETLAKIAPSPENIAKVDALAKQYGSVQQQIAKASDTSLHLREAITRSVSSDVAHYFTDLAQHVHSLGDAFRGLAQTVLKSISDIISKILEAAIQARISGFLNMILGAGAGAIGGASALGNSAIASSSFLGGLADGGHVSGPGGPTEDRVPAMLSAGEYVVRASAVDRVGVGFFDAINAGSMKIRAHAGGGHVARMWEGGMVGHDARGGYAGGGAVAGGAGSGDSDPTHLHVTYDPRVVLEVLRSPAGRKITLGHLQREPKAARQLLGIPSTP